MTDFKALTKEGYLRLIGQTLDRIMHFDIDSISNDLIRSILVIDSKNGEDTDITSDEVLHATDKFDCYKQVWKGVLDNLYSAFLPTVNYNFDWKIELTPYTLLLCDFMRDYEDFSELEKIKKDRNITDIEIETKFEDVLSKLEFDKLELDKIFNEIPKSCLPSSNASKLNLIFRLMNFPPLTELSMFFGMYNNTIRGRYEKLSTAFSGIDTRRLPEWPLSEPLQYSYFHIDHSTFEKIGLGAISNIPELFQFKNEFDKISKEAEVKVGEFSGDYIICGCCGQKHGIEIPKELLQYKFLLERNDLSRRVGLIYFDEFKKTYLNKISKRMNEFFVNINKVDNPSCIILVEGDSEEVAIPILSFRKRTILSKDNIQVYNSKSKQKLAEDFKNFKANFPTRKLICLLDSDAIKEKDNIERMIGEEKNKYKCIMIEEGTLEDIFDLGTSIDILNEMYPDGEPIIIEDFDTAKGFLANVNMVLHTKKLAKFDKVKFARTISFRIDMEKLPDVISKVLDAASDFTIRNKFVRN